MCVCKMICSTVWLYLWASLALALDKIRKQVMKPEKLWGMIFHFSFILIGTCAYT